MREREGGIERERERVDLIIYEILGTRNVISLRNLLEENELIFDRFLTDFVSQITPLHIAIQHRSVDFAREILRRKPQLAYVLSSQGFSPLRMASANGSVDIVRELLPLIVDVSHDRDSKGWTPVHAAAMKGHVDVLEFNETNPESIRDITDRDETVLHLYVKNNNQVDALKMLIRLVGPDNEFVNRKDENGNTVLHLAAMKKDSPDNEFVNRKDENGNTILHLAAMKKDIPMITYLISPETGLEINAMNMNGFTAMDVFALYPSNPADTNMLKKLRENGAERSREKPTAKATSELRNVLMLVGTLTATQCFQAALVPPGGLWQDDSNMGNNALDKTNHTAGTSILAYKDHNRFTGIQITNHAVFALSSILILTAGTFRRTSDLNIFSSFVPFQLNLPVVLGLVSMMIYGFNQVHTPEGLPHDIIWELNVWNKTLLALSLIICFVFFVLNWVQFLKRRGQQQEIAAAMMTRRINQQLS